MTECLPRFDAGCTDQLGGRAFKGVALSDRHSGQPEYGAALRASEPIAPPKPRTAAR